VRWLLVFASGCGRIAFDENAIVTPDAPSPSDDAPAAGCTTFEFDQLPPGFLKVGAGTVEVVNGHVRFAMPGTKNSEAYLQLDPPVSFVGRSTALQVVNPSLTASASTVMGWHQTIGDQVGVHLEMDGFSLKFNRFNSTTDDYTEFVAMPFDAIEFAWWRMREEGGMVIAEVSRDGVAWNPFGSVGGLDLSAIRLDYGIGSYVTDVPPSESLVDNAVTCVP
jgi:hypothetical protein